LRSCIGCPRREKNGQGVPRLREEDFSVEFTGGDAIGEGSGDREHGGFVALCRSK
jgi:hypothetical protein